MLAQETWLFGEEYALTGDDERLTAVLVKHPEILGEDIELADGPQITREDGTVAIPDLVLSRQIKHHQNALQHLVVELKRPSVDIRPAELQQIEDYAFAVAADERFNQPNVSWEFMVVGNKLKAVPRSAPGRLDGQKAWSTTERMACGCGHVPGPKCLVTPSTGSSLCRTAWSTSRPAKAD